MLLSKRKALRRLPKRGLEPGDVARWLDAHRRAQFALDFLTDSRGHPWRARPYQVRSLESYAGRKVHCDGRDVGKTAEIEIIASWAMATCPDTEMLIATQCENHLFPLMNRLARRFQSTPFLRTGLVEVKRSPSWFLRFSNGFVLWGRIAGPGGRNFQGLHVDWQIVDEAQEMTEPSWAELFQSLNGGGRRWVYGVPNGLRNSFYRMTQDPVAEQYNWPSHVNPDFTPEKDEELARLYGGRESAGYTHRVLGQHGTPAHGVFRLEDYLACVDEGADFHDIELGEEDTFEAPGHVSRGEYYLGCDLGYARDPSEFVVYRNAEPHLINVLRIHLRGVNYARQQAVIQELNAAYDFRAVGIDAGNNGRAIVHQLMTLGADWCEKVHGFDFGASIELEPMPDGSPQRRNTKQFMTELIQRRMAERSVVFPRLPDRETQYAAHTYRVGSNGQVVYEKGDDHLIDADRCALLVHHLANQQLSAVALGVMVEGF